MKKDRTVKDLTSWFNDPPFAGFAGVLVFQRLKLVKRSVFNRVGMAAHYYQRDIFLREGKFTFPGSSVPSRAWWDAPCVGFAATLPEALALMYPEDEAT